MTGQQLPPGMTPEMARAAASGMSAMTPDDLERMADQVEAGTLDPRMMGGMGGLGGGAAPPSMEEAMRMMQARALRGLCQDSVCSSLRVFAAKGETRCGVVFSEACAARQLVALHCAAAVPWCATRSTG